MTPAELGTQLRDLRHRAGLSLAGVEIKSGGRWKQAVVGSYERGARKPTVFQLEELLAFYGCRLAVVPATEVIDDEGITPQELTAALALIRVARQPVLRAVAA